jgi:hypothetical protein
VGRKLYSEMSYLFLSYPGHVLVTRPHSAHFPVSSRCRYYLFSEYCAESQDLPILARRHQELRGPRSKTHPSTPLHSAVPEKAK